MTDTMIPLRVLTLIFTGPVNPAVLVLEPIEELKEGCSRVLPIWVGASEAMQLGAAIEHAKTPRPMTHDLFLDALTNLDACVDHVLIDDAKGGTYFAKLVLRQRGRLISVLPMPCLWPFVKMHPSWPPKRSWRRLLSPICSGSRRIAP